MKCKLVDVFAEEKLSGNGLTVFWDCDSLSSEIMLSLTQEMRQFESVFIEKQISNNKFKARIFTVEEELDFAGHPLIGLAAHLHEEYGANEKQEWIIELNNQQVMLSSLQSGNYYQATMTQSRPEFINELSAFETEEIVSALNLERGNIADYPLEVISTGLPYLIVPISTGIDKAKICVDNFEVVLSKFNAKFVYVLDVASIEGRTWDNMGRVEDIATGSAAGPAGAFLYKHGIVQANVSFDIDQGRFVGRPSKITVTANVQDGKLVSLSVSGNVCKVANVNFV